MGGEVKAKRGDNNRIREGKINLHVLTYGGKSKGKEKMKMFSKSFFFMVLLLSETVCNMCSKSFKK